MKNRRVPREGFQECEKCRDYVIAGQSKEMTNAQFGREKTKESMMAIFKASPRKKGVDLVSPLQIKACETMLGATGGISGIQKAIF